MIGSNIIKKTDSYKVSHWKQYPEGTQTVMSYIESRGGKFDETVFFGLQYILLKHLSEPITMRDITEGKKFWDAHLGPGVFNIEGWEHIVTDHDGYLPLIIKAVPEGTVVPVSNALVTCENTCPDCFWLTNYIETLLMQVWYPITVATLSREIKKVILKALEISGDPSLIDFKLHDFGFRGVSSFESAAVGAAAHLINFKGTDTAAGLELINKYYHEEMAGFSIPAAEHSTITAWGENNEVDAFNNMLEQFPKGIVAVVSDSYDIYRACSELWGKELKDKVLARDGIVVVRPDSGVPHQVVLKVINILGDKFGYEVNSKGYRVLNPKIRVIQGDGIDYEEINLILKTLLDNNWSAENIAFGMGGALLQKLDRDTLKFAMKCCSVTIDGKQQDVFKKPIGTDWKKSKAGRLKLINQDGFYKTVNEKIEVENELKTVYKDGEFINEYLFSTIRERAKIK